MQCLKHVHLVTHFVDVLLDVYFYCLNELYSALVLPSSPFTQSEFISFTSPVVVTAATMEFTETVVLYVNGVRHALSNPSHSLTLADFLRLKLGLRGTKERASEICQ
jgi:hypothetical protein